MLKSPSRLFVREVRPAQNFEILGKIFPRVPKKGHLRKSSYNQLHVDTRQKTFPTMYDMTLFEDPHFGLGLRRTPYISAGRVQCYTLSTYNPNNPNE